MFGKLFGKNKNKTDSMEKNIEVETPITAEITPTSNSDVATVDHNEIVQHPKETKETKETQEETKTPPLTYKEMKALKRARYEDKIMFNPMFKKAYLLQNIKTGQVAEIRAASSFHACNIIGWKVNKVRLISEKIIEEKKETKETTA